MKTCTKCKTEKPLDSFSMNKRQKDGRQQWCKACISAHHFANRDSILKKHAQYRESNRLKLREKQAEYNALNASKIRVYSREWRAKIKSDPVKFEKYRKQTAEGVRLSKQRYPEREKARLAVSNAIIAGKITRPSSCSTCGCNCKPEAHHDSYDQSEWFNVRWLCRPCHEEHHRKYPEQKTENKMTTT